MKPDPFRDGPLRGAVREMFNARADASRAALKGYIAATPRDPLGHSLSAAVAFYCFAGNRLRQKSRTSIHETVLFAGIGVPADITKFGRRSSALARSLISIWRQIRSTKTR